MTWCSVVVKIVRITNSLYDPDFVRMFSIFDLAKLSPSYYLLSHNSQHVFFPLRSYSPMIRRTSLFASAFFLITHQKTGKTSKALGHSAETPNMNDDDIITTVIVGRWGTCSHAGA